MYVHIYYEQVVVRRSKPLEWTEEEKSTEEQDGAGLGGGT